MTFAATPCNPRNRLQPARFPVRWVAGDRGRMTMTDSPGPGTEGSPAVAGKTGAAPARCDYLLVAGPGRSGSTWLYRALDAHPAFAPPVAKEGFRYRSVRRFERALRLAGGSILLDAANLAWQDPALENIAALRDRGHRIVVVVLLRRHTDRAVSVIGFRRSRVLPALFSGPRELERAAVRDSLTPAALERIHALGVDVLTVSFEALSERPGTVLGIIARIAGASPFLSPPPAPANPSVRARRPALAAAGKLVAVLLRAAGALRLLQRLKDDPGVMDFFFRPAREADRIRLGPDAEACLVRRYRDCLAALEASCEPLAQGVWLHRAGTPR